MAHGSAKRCVDARRRPVADARRGSVPTAEGASRHGRAPPLDARRGLPPQVTPLRPFYDGTTCYRSSYVLYSHDTGYKRSRERNYELANPTPEQQKKRKEQADRDARLEKRSCR